MEEQNEVVCRQCPEPSPDPEIFQHAEIHIVLFFEILDQYPADQKPAQHKKKFDAKISADLQKSEVLYHTRFQKIAVRKHDEHNGNCPDDVQAKYSSLV
jgi:hypothetical protein